MYTKNQKRTNIIIKSMVIIQQTTYTPLFSRKMKANGNHKNKIVQSQKGGKQTYLCVWRGGVIPIYFGF